MDPRASDKPCPVPRKVQLTKWRSNVKCQRLTRLRCHVIWKPFRVTGLQLTAPTGLWRWRWIFCSNQTWRSSRQNQRSWETVSLLSLLLQGRRVKKDPPHTRWEQAPFPFSVFLSEADGWQPWWRCFSLSHCSCDRREPAGVWLTEVWIERNRPVEEDVRSLMNCFSSCLFCVA